MSVHTNRGRVHGSHTKCHAPAGFTLIEVLVVVAIIALLISILLPSLAKARELARRTVCQSRFHMAGLAVHEYSHANKGKIIQCRSGDYATPYQTEAKFGPVVQVALDPRLVAPSSATASTPPAWLIDWHEAAKRCQLDKALWECPNREGTFLYEGSPSVAVQGYDSAMLKGQGYKVIDNGSDYDQWILGVQYFGGIRQWENAYGTFKSCSPIDANSKPSWALAADSNLKVDTYWGGGRESAFGKIPPHPDASGKPAGGDVLTFDGAVSWIPFGRMIPVHSWEPGTREAYWWQADLGGDKNQLGYFLAKKKQGL